MLNSAVEESAQCSHTDKTFNLQGNKTGFYIDRQVVISEASQMDPINPLHTHQLSLNGPAQVRIVVFVGL